MKSRFSKRRRRNRAARWAAVAAAYAAVSAYYRFRPLPAGINGWDRSYRVPSDRITFWHDTTWYEEDGRHTHREITGRVREIIRGAREFTLLDVFLFNLHHAIGGDFIPTTRQIAEDFAAKTHPKYFITDPLNTSYGTARCRPLEWLEDAGVQICFTKLYKLRDNSLLYSPLWRLFLQWFGTGRSGFLKNPLEKGQTTTVRAMLTAPNARGNHRKVVVADDGAGDYLTLITSSNFEDASCYFLNTALEVRSRAVARHFFEAERAVARMSGCEIPAHIPDGPEEGGDAEVTPLMGEQIKTALLEDIRRARPGDELYLFTLFLADRDVMDEIIAADRRDVQVRVVLDQNKVSFGEEKNGFPNQLTAAELVARTGIDLRWANTRKEEFHTKFLMLRQDDCTIIHAGSANLTRRSLSNTNPEANLRVVAPNDAKVSVDAWQYAHWMIREPQSLSYADGDGMGSRPRYWLARFQEATGLATW